jgi:hypothetical protein
VPGQAVFHGKVTVKSYQQEFVPCCEAKYLKAAIIASSPQGASPLRPDPRPGAQRRARIEVSSPALRTLPSVRDKDPDDSNRPPDSPQTFSPHRPIPGAQRRTAVRIVRSLQGPVTMSSPATKTLPSVEVPDHNNTRFPLGRRRISGRAAPSADRMSRSQLSYLFVCRRSVARGSQDSLPHIFNKGTQRLESLAVCYREFLIGHLRFS